MYPDQTFDGRQRVSKVEVRGLNICLGTCTAYYVLLFCISRTVNNY